MAIADKDIPEYVRRCYDQYISATSDIRESSKQSRRMWVGGKLQWRDDEVANRIGANRPFLSINRCKPSVDQVENEARKNPPGPEAHPVNSSTDKEVPDICEGMIREYEYRSDAHRAYITGLRYACASSAGVFEMATEYAGERSMEQRIIIKEIEDPDIVFGDANARMACREDSMVSGKIRVFSRQRVEEEYGKTLKILNRKFVERAAGWMQTAIGWGGNQSSINMWCGGSSSDEGPYYVCEFYMVRVEKAELALYSDNILRFKDEPIPDGVTIQEDEDGPIKRLVPKRKLKKYVVTALDIISQTEWLGDIIPYYWVLGPEIYIEGKLHRLSLIDGAMDSQRGLNYMATAVAEVVGTMNKSSGFLGYQGQFDTANAQGINPWDDFNMKLYSRMEIKPTWSVNPTTGVAELLPPPQRSVWEAPIQTLIEAATFFGEQIKAATSVFFDPTVQSAKDAQSGEAIKALQSQTNIGTMNWQDNLHRAVTLSYQEAWKILRKITSAQTAVAVVRPDGKHEIQVINQIFQKDGIKQIKNNIAGAELSIRVTVGPSTAERTERAMEKFMDLLHIAPQITQAPGVLPMIVRLVGEGSPQMEQMADALLPPGTNQDMTPEQLKQQIMALQQSDQQKQVLIGNLTQALLAKMPEIQAKRDIALLQEMTKIRVAEINASKDADRAGGEREVAILEHLTGMAHDAATQAVDHEHEKGMAERQAQIGSVQADQQHQQSMEQSDQGHQQALEQQQAAAEQQPASE